MNQTLIVIMNGITYGGLLFMCASGLTLVFGLMRVVNLSHGVFYLVGAYLGLAVQQYTGNWLLGILAGGVATAFISFLLKVTLFERVLGDSERETLLTLGVNLVISDVLLAVFGGTPRNVIAPEVIRTSIDLGFIRYPLIRIIILAIAVAEGIALFLLIKKTRFGQYIRAGVDDSGMTSALGVNIKRVFTVVFILGGFLVGISGVLGGTYLSFTQGFDATILTYSLVVVIIGGIGSLSGAALGALLVGLIDSITKATVSNLSMISIFGALMLVLAFRPNGLMGKGAEK
ncbi:MAG: branched-chain amino acid ABC transporter permease [Christensenellaceae bacterium]